MPTVVVLIHELDSKFVIIIVVVGEPCAHVIEDVVAQDSELILIVIAQVLRIIILVQYGHEKVLGIFAPYCIGIDLSYFVAIEYKRLVLTLDSGYQYTDADLADWDVAGSGSTFRKYYPEYYDLAVSYGLDPALKPTRLDISETVRWLGYRPTFSLASLLSELATYGDSGPLRLTQV